MIRRLYLGSVSSLSFEEEENEFCCATKNQGGEAGIVGDKQSGEVEAGLNMELHEMLTDRLYEQVSDITHFVGNPGGSGDVLSCTLTMVFFFS